MSFLDRLLAAPSPRASVEDDRWWSVLESALTPSGVRVDADSAMKVSAFFAGVRLLSCLVGRLPVGIFRQGGRDQDKEHWAYRRLARAPNDWQTPFEFKQELFSDVLRWGNGYAEKVFGGRDEVEELRPVHPTRVTPQRLTSGALVYKVKKEGMLQEEVWPQERMLHWRSPFSNGPVGLSLLSYARDTLGHALAQGSFVQRQFSQGLLHKFAATMPANMTLSEQTKKQLKEVLNEKSGLDEAHRVLVLPGGLELKPMSMSMADAQFLQQEEFTMMQLAQFLGIPPHMLELVSRTTSWGTGIEQQTIGFNVYTMDPWLTHLEESIDRDLLDGGEFLYAKFNRRALLAADMNARGAFYRNLASIKSITPNEVRGLEDMDPVPWGDEPLPSPNESVAGSDAPRPRDAQAMAIVEWAAARLVRKEQARVAYLHKRSGADEEAFAGAVAEFYSVHAFEVAQALALSLDDALAYCEGHRDAVVAEGLGAMAGWETDGVKRLAELAMGKE